MRVLVTGAGGFAGQHLVRALLMGGAHVVGTTLDGHAPKGRTLNPAEVDRVEWQALDITSDESIRTLFRQGAFDEVYHLAGQSSVGESFADPMWTWEVNATGTIRLLTTLQRASSVGTRVLVISSAEVYGSVPLEEQPVKESRVAVPVTPYGASKLAAEAAAYQAASENLHVVIARSFNHAGPGQDERFIFPSIARQLNAMSRFDAEPVLLVGNLEARRDFLDVRDVARAYLRLMKAGRNRGVYNVCSGVSRSLQELVEDLVDISGTCARIRVDPDRFRPVDIPEMRGSAARLRELGWEPAIQLRQTLEDLYAEVEKTGAISGDGH